MNLNIISMNLFDMPTEFFYNDYITVIHFGGHFVNFFDLSIEFFVLADISWIFLTCQRNFMLSKIGFRIENSYDENGRNDALRQPYDSISVL